METVNLAVHDGNFIFAAYSIFFFFMYERTAVSMHFSVLYANTQSIKQERRQTFF